MVLILLGLVMVLIGIKLSSLKRGPGEPNNIVRTITFTPKDIKFVTSILNIEKDYVEYHFKNLDTNEYYKELIEVRDKWLQIWPEIESTGTELESTEAELDDQGE